MRTLFYENLILLFNRAELDINLMGFDQSFEIFLKNQRKEVIAPMIMDRKYLEKVYKDKLQVVLKYHNLLIKALSTVFHKLIQKGGYNKREV